MSEENEGSVIDTSSEVDPQESYVDETVVDDEQTDDLTDDGDADESESYEVEPELVEVEIDGEKFELPQKLKDAFMRTDDYTRKTQSLAEQRKSAEAEQQEFARYRDITNAHMQAQVQLSSLDQRLSEFNNIDWNAAADIDPTAATKLNFEYQQLQHARNQIVQQMQLAEGERQRLQAEKMARTEAQAHKELSSRIPGWGDKTKQEVQEFAISELGFAPEAVKRAVSSKELETLYYAKIGREALKKQRDGVEKAKRPQAAKEPTRKIGAKNQKARPNLDKMSADEYRKWRQKGKK